MWRCFSEWFLGERACYPCNTGSPGSKNVCWIHDAGVVWVDEALEPFRPLGCTEQVFFKMDKQVWQNGDSLGKYNSTELS